MLDTDRITAAFRLAADVHRTQTRKGTNIPYIAHPMAVASQVLLWSGSEDAFIGALLHDVLEDGSPAYAAEIREKFGETVLGIVAACSELRPEPGDHIPWLTRKTTYIAHLEALGEEGEPQAVVEGALLVGAADKRHNLESILEEVRARGDAVFSKFVTEEPDPAKKKELSLWYYESLVSIYEKKGVKGAAELRRILEEIRALCA